MRCPACRVDLNENACRCPLCGGPAEDAPPLIPGVAYQDYPAYEPRRPRRKSLPPGRFLPETVSALSLLLIWAGYRHGVSVAAVLSCAAAALALAAALVLSALLRRRRERCLAPLLLLALLGAAGFGVAWAAGGRTGMALSACALALSLLNLAALRGLCGKALLEELKARFML